MDDVLKDFLTESHESLDLIDVGLASFMQDPSNMNPLNDVFRLVHTVKGTCGFLNLPRLEALCHAAESMIYSFRLGSGMSVGSETLVLKSVELIKHLLREIEANDGVEPAGDDSQLIDELEQAASCHLGSEQQLSMITGEQPMSQLDLDRLFDDQTDTAMGVERAFAPSGPKPLSRAPSKLAQVTAPRQTLRVRVALMEQLVSHVTDLIAIRAQMLEIARRSDDYELKTTVNRLADIASRLQKVVVKSRVQPISAAWQQLQPMTRELSTRLNKDIALVLDGGDIEVDRQILDLIKAPLAHMVRNCADHGLESREERVASGKPAQGTIGVTVVRQGSDIVIEVLDDGLGLDTARIKRKALEAGLIDDAAFANMDETQADQLIFEPGLSTCETVTRLSGRGIGLDVVRTSIEKTGGSIKVHSARGEGTVFTIRIPATPAQISSLILAGTKDHEKILLKNPLTDTRPPAFRASSSSASLPDATSDAELQKNRSLPGPQTKVLFLEANPFFETMLTPVMEAGGYDVTVVGSVSEALTRLASDTAFLAIVIDVDAPDKVGFDFAQNVKNNQDWADTSLIAVSSLATSLSVKRAKEAGYDHCLAKFDRNGLLSCLNKITYRLKVAA